MAKRYEGIIFYNVDDDIFAYNLGRYLTKRPPMGIKIVRYNGGLHPDGLRAYLQREQKLRNIPFNELCDIIGVDIFKEMRAIDSNNWDTITHPWEKKIISRYNAKFSIELHSTLLSNLNKIYITCHINNFNKNISELLNQYLNVIVDWKKNAKYIRGGSVYADHGANPYHQITLEHWHNIDVINNKKVIEATSFLIYNLSGFIAERYYKLWKKYK
jgi:hypothetical protein